MSAWKQRVLVITLEQDVILGATGASTGNLDTLDYLPGSVFLGVAASRLYASLSDTEAWQLFHSGAVRFNDALPLASGEVTWPMPLNWHHYKGEAFKRTDAPASRDTLDATRLFDPVLGKDKVQQERQPKQLRKDYVSASGAYYKSGKHLRMKTALDADTGRAAEGQLFGYQSLNAGQSFYLVLEAGAEHEALLDRVAVCLSGGMRLGRSRSAQYGRATCELQQSPAAVMPTSARTDAPVLTLWLLSDLALVDGAGQPTVQPLPERLGLPVGSEWLSDQSFLRTRRYSPYNAYRRSHDEERQVVCRGSVLRYRLTEALSKAQCEALQQGIGLHQSAGLGRIAVNPEMLSQATPAFADASLAVLTSTAAHRESAAVATPKATRLIKVLEQRTSGSGPAEAAEKAQKLFKILSDAVQEARVWQGVATHQPVQAPNRSQWGRIKELANRHRRDPAGLRRELYSGTQAVIRGRSGWELEVGPGETLEARIMPLLQETPDDILPDVMGQLAALGLTQHWERMIQGSTGGSESNEQGRHGVSA